MSKTLCIKTHHASSAWCFNKEITVKKIKIGFLPFYIKLYDDCGFTVRPRTEPFYETLASKFEDIGFDVERWQFCRTENEFKEAVEYFEKEAVDAVVTWHAAYSPSLESVNVLKETKLPIVILDTTEVYDFSSTIEPDELNYCHGIHGVMDICNMLRRCGKQFAIAAGHSPSSDVVERAAGYVKAAVAASAMDKMKVGSIGGSFDGMGDFFIADDEKIGNIQITPVYPNGGELAKYRLEVTEDEIDRELEFDAEHYVEIGEIDEETHRKTARNCLAVRKWIENNSLGAFTANFREITPECGLEIMPFMEACKAMARGIGYAGEGDTLTAALTGALIKGFKDAAFVEIFCPDWRGNTLFLSHMGEYNPNLTSGTDELKKIPFIFGEADDPVVGYGCYKGGSAVFVNLYKNAKGTFSMLICPVEMQEIYEDNFVGSVRGWMKPQIPVADFLETLSRHGATHHSCLIYGALPRELEYFANLIGVEPEII